MANLKFENGRTGEKFHRRSQEEEGVGVYEKPCYHVPTTSSFSWNEHIKPGPWYSSPAMEGYTVSSNELVPIRTVCLSGYDDDLFFFPGSDTESEEKNPLHQACCGDDHLRSPRCQE